MDHFYQLEMIVFCFPIMVDKLKLPWDVGVERGE